MRKTAFAAVAALLAGACATPAATNGARSAAAAGTQYCWQDRLSSAGGVHTCNWSASARDACDATQFTAIEAARYSVPQRVRMCHNGQWIVEASPRG